MKKLSSLGRGLASLIPSKRATAVVAQTKGENIYNVEINSIRPNANQPRQDFDLDALGELASSIKKFGILQPLVVTRIATDTDRGREVEYEIVAGERRWRAAKMAGLPHVPVIVRDDFEESRMKLEVALVENIQRKDLNVLEEAEAYDRLANEFDLTQEQIAQKVGKSREAVANTIRVMNLPANIKEAIRSGKIERTHARALLAFKDADHQQTMFKQLLAGSVGSKDLERTAQMVHGTRKDPSAVHPRFVELQSNLTRTLGTSVAIKPGLTGGRIEIKFANLEELNKIAKTLLD
ncbi:MAG: ParB/RepB/Spo0J family partition protein [Patescibacteria group bacterium]